MNLYIVDNTVNFNILKSQLLVPLEMLGKHNSNYKILIPSTYLERLGKLHPLNDNFLSYRNKKEKIKYLLKAKSTYKFVYTRSILEFVTLRLIKFFCFSKYLIVYDFRGLSFAEFDLKNRKGLINSLKIKILYHLEKYAFKRADRIHTVSDKFKEYLIEQFNHKRSVVVIPCCIKKPYGLELNSSKVNRFDFVYLGSVSEWQKFNYTISLFKEIQKEINEATLTVITNDINKAQLHLIAKDIQANVLSLPHEEVLDELKKYNFGFLLRDRLLLNKVASPVKFLEYLNAGVIPIISPEVGDYSKLVVDNGIGLCYENNQKDLIKALTSFSRTPYIIEQLKLTLRNHSWQHFYLKLDFK